jgi:endo-1,3-1,4-beta-glycanase ExoK
MRALRLTTLAATALLAVPAAATDQRGFLEEFDTLDRDRWFISDGWVNGPHQNCLWSAEAVQLRDGVLRLSVEEAAEGPEAYLCAEIQSEDRFGFGVFEALVNVPFAKGTNSNFFTFIGPPQNLPHHEIDFEFLARSAPVLQTNTYVEGTGGNEALLPITDEDGWHHIAFIWEAERLRWYLNGTLIRTLEGGKVPSLKQKIYLSIWTTDILTDWMGRFEWAGPLVFQVDWVAYTPLEQECRFEASILCDEGYRAALLDTKD